MHKNVVKGRKRSRKKMKTEAKREIEMHTGHIPMDVLVDILCRLPAEFVWKLRSVCKDWKSLIESPPFVDLHLRRSKERGFMVWGYNVLFYMTEFYSVDKDGQAVTVVGKEFVHPTIYISSCINGLICYFGTDQLIKVFNPVTHEQIVLPKPTFFLSQPQETTHYLMLIVFGFDSTAKRYKVMAVNGRNASDVEIFTLGGTTKCWRKVHVSIAGTSLYSECKYVNGCVYWLTSGYNHQGVRTPVLVSFNFAEEKFELVPLPADIDTRNYDYRIQMGESGGCFCLVELKKDEKTETVKLTKLVNSGTQVWVDQIITLSPFKDICWVCPISSGLMLVYTYKNNSGSEVEKYITYYNEEGQVVKSIEVHGIEHEFYAVQLHLERLVSLRSILAGES